MKPGRGPLTRWLSRPPSLLLANCYPWQAARLSGLQNLTRPRRLFSRISCPAHAPPVPASGGLLQYKTLIHQDGEDVPLLNGEFKKGFDHLSNGFAISQFIGYFHLADNEPINFYAGFEFHQAWTKNRRDYNLDIKGPDDTLRRDFLFGIRFGWVFPINKRTSNVHYYYWSYLSPELSVLPL